ncbi:MAG: MarR family transcriptional regulator [Anaerolineales bacterium]|nr:MarR family transcriptional regulator [Anaerolineales bacterium]
MRRTRGTAMMSQAGLYQGQPFLLSCLWENEGLTHTELANQLGVQPATISVALQRMEKTGFIERQPDPDDQRVSRVFLTDAGRDIRPAVEKIWQEIEQISFQGLSAEEIQLFRSMLTRICNNLKQD